MQDFTGVPAVVDLAAMRSAVARLGGDPKKLIRLCPLTWSLIIPSKLISLAQPTPLHRNTEDGISSQS